MELIHQHCANIKILELYPIAESHTLEEADAWIEVPGMVPADLADQVTRLAKAS